MGERMCEGEFDSSGDRAVSSELAGVLPVEYVAFHSQHHSAYLRYAHLQLGGRQGAVAVVDDVFTFLLKVWPQALREENLHAFAWAVLREHVERWLAVLDRPVAMVETAWFAALRRTSRKRLELLESKLGLYAAIAELPERHYDVVLLTFLEGLEGETVAQLMGISPATVRSHIRGARRTLARKIGLDVAPGEEKDQ
ncbi:sigma-70 family RNA polymerase sigma factor [Streptomyces sp. CJ_13]|nr:ECF subfamily RNA polymerase sigma factor [Streptomyces sp. Mg1]MBP0932192.1 sigma-70 family RNA polymerase sigma factor [Streptomyces sp. KCTC 0041BP]MBT1186680.1 sigma-70 family RNA polymerase sigma factor [Streptomyces sp. CJ_13]OKI42871.1 RNA polymerase subunit sigma [Streptomyces sp. CB03578]PJN17596.1 sigma-70 family RNA polymerase sigma factor [Streptomyces sp. CB02120-2]